MFGEQLKTSSKRDEILAMKMAERMGHMQGGGGQQPPS